MSKNRFSRNNSAYSKVEQGSKKSKTTETDKNEMKKKAIEEYERFKMAVNDAVIANTLDVFLNDNYQIMMIPNRLLKYFEYGYENMEGTDAKGKKIFSLKSLSYLIPLEQDIYNLQGVLLNSSNQDCQKQPNTSHVFEYWRLFLKTAIDASLVVRSIYEYNIGTFTNRDLTSCIFNGNRLTQATIKQNNLLDYELKGLKAVDDKLNGMISGFDNYNPRLHIHDNHLVIIPPYAGKENFTRIYRNIKIVQEELGKTFSVLSSITNSNQLPLKVKLNKVVGESLRRYLKSIQAIKKLIEIDPILFIQTYLADRPELDGNAKQMIAGVSNVVNWLISHNGIVSDEGVALYRKTIQDLTKLPCDPKHGEFLSILEIDKMNLDCFNKISNLTSFDLNVLDTLKHYLLKLNFIFNAIYDENILKYKK